MCHFIDRWVRRSTSQHGRHILNLLFEIDGARESIKDDLRQTIRDHYMDPEIASRRLDDIGASGLAAIFQQILPQTPTARSGDMGEILATETAECVLGFEVPVRRLQWKDGREMALRGDDIIGVIQNTRLTFLKGESKSRQSLGRTPLQEATDALVANRGRPSPTSVMFIANVLRERSQDELATLMETAVVEGFDGYRVEHFVFALSGNNPTSHLTEHLEANTSRQRKQHYVGLHVEGHGEFVRDLFGGI